MTTAPAAQSVRPPPAEASASMTKILPYKADTLTTTHVPQAAAPHAAAPAPAAAADAFEVGWLFVQEYYTFLNRDPQRLHCFYNKRSSFLHGHEGGAAKTCAGQTEIHNRIMDLDFQDCKVLVSNLDSLPSQDGGIIVQVLGEMSNKGGTCHKFAQTFFLAVQPNGYYVLNDIFRFLKEDIDNVYEDPEDPVPKYEEPVKNAPASTSAASSVHLPAPAASQTPAAAVAHVPASQNAARPPAAAPAVHEKAPAPAAPASSAPAATKTTTAVGHSHGPNTPAPAQSQTVKTAQPVESSKNVSAEKPKDAPVATSTSPKKTQQAAATAQKTTPAATASVATAAATTASTAPVQAKSWAALASAVNPSPSVASVMTASVPAPTTASTQPSKPPAKAYSKGGAGGFGSGNFKKDHQGQQQQQQQQHQQAESGASDAQQPGSDEFREVQPRREYNRRNAPNSASSGTQFAAQNHHLDERDKNSIYIRNLPDGTDKDVLTKVFGHIGSIRSVELPGHRNMAFIEFAQPESALKAIGTPFDLNGTKVVPEERRRPVSNYRGNNSNRASYGNNNNNNASNGNVSNGPGLSHGQGQNQSNGGRANYAGRGRGRGRNNYNNNNSGSAEKAPVQATVVSGAGATGASATAGATAPAAAPAAQIKA